MDPSTTMSRRSRPLVNGGIDPGRLLELVDAFASARVTVFGDLLVDEFIYGEVSRVSREAPVLILDYDSTDIVPGGAGNAANNVAALGGSVLSVGVAGRDEPGRRAARGDARQGRRARHRASLELSDADEDAHPRGRRALGEAAGGPDRSRDAPRARRRRPPRDRIAPDAGRVDAAGALLVSDYGTGLVTPAVIRRARQRLARGGRRRSCSSIPATACCAFAA